MSKKKFTGSISGRGYYIALILCAAAIGITGYLYYRNTSDTNSQLSEDPAQVIASDPDQIQAVATGPVGTEPSVEDTKPQATQNSKLATAAPVDGQILAVYAMDALSYNQTTRDWRTHNGIDIAADAGTTVKAAADGEVYTVYEDDTMGTTVVICHDGGYVTRYASLDQEVSVAPGDTVSLGDAIGTVGNTALLENAVGDHVHFSVTCNGEPMDPEAFLDMN